jgi:CTP:molybdopterin cytidylyltransferase MocA
MVAGRAALVVAAGASERMGTPKALLPWGGSTLIDYAVDQARVAGAADVVVVLGPATGPLELNATVVLNPRPDSGRSASIRLAAASLSSEPEAIVIQSVDQPVAAHILKALYEAVNDEVAVAVPTFNGRRGHPVCVAGRLLPELCALSEAQEGLRAVVRRHAAQLREVAVASESVIWNLNDPAAYASARARQ